MSNKNKQVNKHVEEEEEDQFDDEELLAELGEAAVKVDESFAKVVVVDGLPTADAEKYNKLLDFIKKFFSKFGQVQDIYMPINQSTNKTHGFAFVEYNTVEEARSCITDADNKPLDKAHTIRVNPYDDFARLTQVSDEFEGKLEDFEAKDHYSRWLLDSRSQYVVRHSTETEVFWNDSLFVNENGRKLVYAGEEHKSRNKQWTELSVSWSPKGTFLATFHQQGIALWGGDSFARMGRLQHPGVRFIEFSPNENYVITSNGSDRDKEAIIVWDVRTGKKLRAFENTPNSSWPAFKWSHDDAYIARTGKDKAGKDVISVYQVPEMGLLDKKSIMVPGVGDIEWCPTRNLISYWIPEKDNVPAKVSIISIPSREVVREKNMYSVSNIKMYWQSQGRYLAVQMLRNKTKKTICTNFEVFNFSAKDVPVESIELEDPIVAFAWEPRGLRFAVIHNRGSDSHVSFYSLKKNLHLAGTLNNRTVNNLCWSPWGDYILLSSLGPQTGHIECVETNSLYSIAKREHYMCSDVAWDPTGRFVISSVTQPLMNDSAAWRYASENGYKVWTLDGKNSGLFVCTTEVTQEKCYQVMWRPRPATLLNEEQIKELTKTMREKHGRRFEQEDEKIRISQLSEAEQSKMKLRDEWKEYRSRRNKDYQDEGEHRRKLRAGRTDDEFVDVEELIEVEISAEEENVDL